ncbi:MAG: 6-phosphofructokinase [Clostridiales bacterium]|jgi:6-phosphofructokinase|nr:6-phosphofructokinase [Clostridiales bacterium]
MKKRNALVAQSGGPSPVINASLQGVLEACFQSDRIETVYAAYRGIEGVLLEELIDMSKQPIEEIRRLKNTPAAGAIGSCRYKLKEGNEADFQRIVDVFKAHNIGYFFYIGGNDSMDTADKVNKLAHEQGYELTVMGVPKTIDNDLGDEERTIIDHTPGYGSCARYWAYIIQNIDEENRAMCTSECVSVIQAMGRDSGFITAAARLADPNREMPLQLYLPESKLSMEDLLANVDRELLRSGRCIVVVPESFMTDPESQRRDGFGHVEYGASKTTAMQQVVNALNEHGLPVRGQATGQVPGVLQRGVSLHASVVDREEAYALGKNAVEYALSGITGKMATILRNSDEPYSVRYDNVPLSVVANRVRYLPKEWIAPSGIDVTDDFIRYARPLIGDSMPSIELEGGLQRFARIKPVFVDKKLPDYTPCNFQSTR